MADGLLVGDIFRSAARAAPDRVAVWHGAASITFAERSTGAATGGSGVRRVGVGHTDRVVAGGTTRTLDVLPLFAALAKLGAVFAPISPLLASPRRPR